MVSLSIIISETTPLKLMSAKSIVITVTAILTLFLSGHVACIERFNESGCIKSFAQLEKTVITRGSNVDKIMDGFYPPNKQITMAANVYYFFENSSSFDYKFRWSASPILQVIRPELLEYLSLGLFSGRTETVNVIISAPICGMYPAIQRDGQQFCYGELEHTDPVWLLNKFTTHVRLLPYYPGP